MESCSRCEHEVGELHEFEVVIRPRRAKVAGETVELGLCRWCASELRGELSPDELRIEVSDERLVAPIADD